MKPKLKPDLDLESIQADLVTSVCEAYKLGVSIRAVAKSVSLSPMKVRKILITGGCYSNDMSTEIDNLWKDGKTVQEIAEILNTSVSNVSSYLPYERIIYNMDEKSVEADRQQRYRDRKKGIVAPVEEKKQIPKFERVRNKTLIIVVGKKLRSAIPGQIIDTYSDPLSRDIALWGEDQWNPKDPAANIWCAELVTNGRGKNKKTGIMLENCNCGFAACAPLPIIPAPADGIELSREELRLYRENLEQTIISTIRSAMLAFCLPENPVADYVDTVARVELVKGKPTTPLTRVEELIKGIEWPKDTEPSEAFRVRSNFDSRKFGNSPWYRRVDEAVCKMLLMTDEEEKAWLDRFMAPVRERLSTE